MTDPSPTAHSQPVISATDNAPTDAIAVDHGSLRDNSFDDVDPEDRQALHLDDPDDSWAQGPAKRGVRLRVPTAVLLVLIAVAAGFWGGALAEKHHGSGSSGTAALASRLSALRSSFGGTGTGTRTGGFGGTGTTGGTGTRGIVTAVKGQTLYITTSTGSLVTVTLAPGATISAPSSLAALKQGQTVLVEGTTGANGSLAATAITESAATATGATSGTGTASPGSGS